MSFALSELSFEYFLLVSRFFLLKVVRVFALAHSSACCQTLGSKRIELCSKRSEMSRCAASFLAFRLSFPPCRRAALKMPRLSTRSTSRSSRSSQPPAPNNDEPPSRMEPSPSPSTSQPLRLSGSPRRSVASKCSRLRRDQQHQKPSPPPRCYRRTVAG